MSEGVNRFSARDRALEARNQHPDIWTACLYAADDLEAEFAGILQRSGDPDAGKHFTLRVVADSIEIAVLSHNAWGWGRIRRLRRDESPTCYGHPIKIVRRTA